MRTGSHPVTVMLNTKFSYQANFAKVHIGIIFFSIMSLLYTLYLVPPNNRILELKECLNS